MISLQDDHHKIFLHWIVLVSEEDCPDKGCAFLSNVSQFSLQKLESFSPLVELHLADLASPILFDYLTELDFGDDEDAVSDCDDDQSSSMLNPEDDSNSQDYGGCLTRHHLVMSDG